MTSLIDDCFNHHISQYPLLYTQHKQYKKTKQYKDQHKFNNFLSNLIQISPDSYILSQKSQKNSNNITYFTTLTIQQSCIQIKILFINPKGSIIHNRQKFFLNNQNRQIYSFRPYNLKSNPISGQLYVKYSYFYHNHVKFDILWKDLYKKIENVQRELRIVVGISKGNINMIKKDQNIINEDYYYENVDEQKNIQNVIYAVKLAQIVKENVNLQNQLLRQNNTAEIKKIIYINITNNTKSTNCISTNKPPTS